MSPSLTLHRPSSLKETLTLFLPLIFSSLSGILMIFSDRIFISHYSLVSLKAITAAQYFCMVFQSAFSRVTTTSQVCISSCVGKGAQSEAGPFCWQMIYFSILSIIITLPISYLLIPYLFTKQEIAFEGLKYFKILIWGNFLFPLGSSLGAYFIGIGKTKIVGVCFAMVHLVNILMDYLLIFGWQNLFPPLGIKGAALATIISQSLFCLFLLCCFIFFNQHDLYNTRSWKFNKNLFKKAFWLGTPKSLSKMSILVAWAASVKLVTQLEGAHLLILSVGSSLWYLFSPLNQALEQVLTTQVAFYKARNQIDLIWKSVRSAVMLVIVKFLCIGLLIFIGLSPFLHFFIQEEISPQSLHWIQLSVVWLWIFLFFEGLASISSGIITGIKDTFFILKMNLIINWPTIFLPFYLAFYIWHCPPDVVWMLPWVCVIVAGSICFIRARIKLQRLSTKQPQLKVDAA